MTYTFITRDPGYKLYFLPTVDEQKILAGAPESWVKHPRVQLDADISVYYTEVMDWARQRRSIKQNPPPTHPMRRADLSVPPSDVVMLDGDDGDGREINLIGLASLV